MPRKLLSQLINCTFAEVPPLSFPNCRDTVISSFIKDINGIAHGSFIASLVAPPVPQTNYILISPLLTPISNFTTFFTISSSKGILSKSSRETHSKNMQNILAIYGTGDVFALSTWRYRRHFENLKRDWKDQLKVVEIEEGGHFWLDARSRKTLLNEVKAFIDG